MRHVLLYSVGKSAGLLRLRQFLCRFFILNSPQPPISRLARGYADSFWSAALLSLSRDTAALSREERTLFKL